MQTNAITHFLRSAGHYYVVGCGSNAPQQNTAKKQTDSDEISETATSWHCEQGLQTQSCKRRSIADIQQREAERKNKRFDWSQPQPTTPTGTGETLFELAPADVPAMEPPTAALDSRSGEWGGIQSIRGSRIAERPAGRLLGGSVNRAEHPR